MINDIKKIYFGKNYKILSFNNLNYRSILIIININIDVIKILKLTNIKIQRKYIGQIKKSEQNV